MRILIISANREMNPDPVFPLGAAYIAQAAENAGHETHIFDACFREQPADDLQIFLKKNRYDLIGISLRNVDDVAFPQYTCYLPYYREIMQTVRKASNAPVVLGGSGFSIFPEIFMRELGAEYGITGDGERAFPGLIADIENRRAKKGICSGADIEITDSGFPLRRGFDIEKYYTFSGCINIQTKRGCALDCTYCTYPFLEGKKYRFRSPSDIADEILYWKERDISHFFFVDSTFNFPEKFGREIIREIINRKLDIKWTGYFVPKVEDDDFIRLLAESGCTSLDFGTDALHPETIRGYKKNFSVDDVFRAAELCHTHNIKFNHSLILGGPGETFETMETTISNAEKMKPVSVIAFLGVRVYPQTAMIRFFIFPNMSSKTCCPGWQKG